MPGTMSRAAIVNADDFGQSAGINRGIVEAHERGIVTSASLMVRWPCRIGRCRVCACAPAAECRTSRRPRRIDLSRRRVDRALRAGRPPGRARGRSGDPRAALALPRAPAARSHPSRLAPARAHRGAGPVDPRWHCPGAGRAVETPFIASPP